MKRLAYYLIYCVFGSMLFSCKHYAELDVIISTTQPLCFNDSSGMAQAVAIGGVPPYNYLWNNGQTISELSNLVSGNYEITITDSEANTCYGTIAIFSPPALQITDVSFDNSDHLQSGTHQATVHFSGGTGPYYDFMGQIFSGAITYEFIETQTLVITYPIGALWSGVITDFNECSNSGGEIGNANPYGELVVYDWYIVPIDNESDGMIKVFVTGVTPPYLYSWEGPLVWAAPEPFTEVSELHNLPMGWYILEVIDSSIPMQTELFWLWLPRKPG